MSRRTVRSGYSDHKSAKMGAPAVEFMNDNFRKISRFLPNAIHKCVFPQDLFLSIDFQVQGLEPGFLSQ